MPSLARIRCTYSFLAIACEVSVLRIELTFMLWIDIASTKLPSEQLPACLLQELIFHQLGRGSLALRDGRDLIAP